MNDPTQSERGREHADLGDAFTRGGWQPSVQQQGVQPQGGPRMLAGGIALVVVAGAAFGLGAMTSHDHRRAAPEPARELALTSRYRIVHPSGRPGAMTVPDAPRPAGGAQAGGTGDNDVPHADAPGKSGSDERRTEPKPVPTRTLKGLPPLTVPVKAPARDGAEGEAEGEKDSNRVTARRKLAERSARQGGETAPSTVPDLPAPARSPKSEAAKPQTSEWPTIRTGPPPTEPPPAGRSAKHDAYGPIQAETLDRQSNLGTESTGDVGGGQNLAWISDGDWALYEGVGFGLQGARRFYARVASGAGTSGRIEVRLDDLSSPPVGAFTVTDTGGWQTYRTVEADIEKVAGVHDVYLRFTSGQSGDFVNLHWFDFGH